MRMHPRPTSIAGKDAAAGGELALELSMKDPFFHPPLIHPNSS